MPLNFFCKRITIFNRSLIHVVFSFGLLLLLATRLSAESVTPVSTGDPSYVPPTAEKRVVRLTEKGFEPGNVVLHKEDASVFFVNSTNSTRIDVAIDFGPRRKHCWTKNMEVSNDGVIHTTKPLEPEDFALVCFPEPGEYIVTAKGIPAKPQGVTAKIVVP